MKVVKRSGKIESFDTKKIIKAVEKAYRTQGLLMVDKVVFDAINNMFDYPDDTILSIEVIQDNVEHV